jgi:hypothetical protein
LNRVLNLCQNFLVQNFWLITGWFWGLGGWKGGWKDGCMDVWIYGWIDGWMDVRKAWFKWLISAVQKPTLQWLYYWFRFLQDFSNYVWLWNLCTFLSVKQIYIDWLIGIKSKNIGSQKNHKNMFMTAYKKMCACISLQSKFLNYKEMFKKLWFWSIFKVGKLWIRHKEYFQKIYFWLL